MRGGWVEVALRRDRALLVGAMGVLFLLAGLYTIFGVGMSMSALDMTRMAGMTDMPSLRTPGAWSAGFTVLIVLMWWVMMVAMMLPSVAPVILLYAALIRRSSTPDRARNLGASFLAGYLLAWLGFSLGAALCQWALEYAGVVSASMMTLLDTRLGAVVLIAAGAFQFTPLKDSCLSQCRSPAKFLSERHRPGLRGHPHHHRCRPVLRRHRGGHARLLRPDNGNNWTPRSGLVGSTQLRPKSPAESA